MTTLSKPSPAFRPKSWLLVLGLFAYAAALGTAFVAEGFSAPQFSSASVTHRTGRVAGSTVDADRSVELKVTGGSEYQVVTNGQRSPYQIVRLAEQRSGLAAAWRNIAGGQELATLGAITAGSDERWIATVDGEVVAMDASEVRPGATLVFSLQPR